ncbi:MAG: hypothetical protein M3Y60_15120, partial [Bacteroidota bacterium]|nr:hypothetical protein [Bacteroidota bacterium]
SLGPASELRQHEYYNSCYFHIKVLYEYTNTIPRLRARAHAHASFVGQALTALPDAMPTLASLGRL